MTAKKTTKKAAPKKAKSRKKAPAVTVAGQDDDGTPAYGEDTGEPGPAVGDDWGYDADATSDAETENASDDADPWDEAQAKMRQETIDSNEMDDVPVVTSENVKAAERLLAESLTESPWWLRHMIARDGARYSLMDDEVYERLPVALTTDEMMDRSKEQARRQKELEELKGRNKEAKAVMARKEAELALRVSELAEVVDSGEEHREVRCARVADPNRCMAILVRLDSTTPVPGRERPLTEREVIDAQQLKML